MNKIFKNKRLMTILIVLLLCLATLGTSVGVTLAKYRIENTSEEVKVPTRFYFESNLLSEDNPSYEIGINYIRIDLMNYADSLRVSESDITYEVTISSADSSASLGTAEGAMGTLTKEVQSKATVSFTGLTFGKTYTVTAKATAPYTKTVSATFTILEKENSLAFEVRDEGNSVYLTLRTNELDSTVNIYWQEGYVPYNANDALAAATGKSAKGIKLNSYSVYEFRFFKEDLSAAFNISDFYVEISEPAEPEDSTQSGVVDKDNSTGAWD